MFFEGNRIELDARDDSADTKEHRQEALAKILPYQREDFIGMFKELADVRLRSVSLTRRCMNFFPHEGTEQGDLGKENGRARGKDQEESPGIT